MKTIFSRTAVITVFLLLAVLSEGSFLVAQEQAPAQTQPAVEEMTAEEFTQLLKGVWSFLKNEREEFEAAAASKSEFETTREHEQRILDRRRQYVANIIKYSRDQKFNTRKFHIYFKARLDDYNADKKVYTITSPNTIDAPYNIPTVRCVVPRNPYVALADSVRKGYRTSVLYLSFKPAFLWNTPREIAQTAKQDEPNVNFRILASIDIESNDGKAEAILAIIPSEMALVNNVTNQIFWERKRL